MNAPTTRLGRAWSPERYRLEPGLSARIPSPALLVYLDRFRANVERMAELLGGDVARWRPHVKTTKSPRLWAELLERGVTAFKCATALEAEELLVLASSTGRPIDLLVAYPHHGPTVERIARLAREHGSSRVSVLVESEGDVARWPAELGLFVDLNCGMDRTGVQAEGRGRVFAVAAAAGERLRGLHWYDGQHVAPGERRVVDAHAGYRELADLVVALERRGVRVHEIVTSGTPALGAALSFEGFEELEGVRHRVSPGTLVLHDVRSEELDPELGFEPAAVVFTRVVSAPRRGRVTCDAGSKAVSAEAGSPVASVLGWPRLVPATPSEEHLPLDGSLGSADELPARGSELLLVPRHVCTTVNLYDEALLVEGGRVVGRMRVSARGHDLAGLEWIEENER
ncbi:MAG: alanine racemase [Planctomycetota bacterium]